VQNAANKSAAVAGVSKSGPLTARKFKRDYGLDLTDIAGVPQSGLLTGRVSTTRYANTDPVDLFSGSYASVEVDLGIPGLLPLQVVRSYNSAFADRDGPFGKGSGLVPYNARITVRRDANGVVSAAPGTVLVFSGGDQAEVPFTDLQGNLQFTAPSAPAFAGDQISVETDAGGRLTGAVLLLPDGDRFVFDPNGDLVRIEDRNGNAVTVIRDASTHKIMRLEDPSTQKGIDFTYNDAGLVTQVVATGGQQVSYAYDNAGRLITITDTLGQTVQFGYDDAGRLATVTDPRQIQTLTNTYDADGRVVEQTLGDGSRITIACLSETTRRVTDGSGRVIEYRYDPSGLFAGITTGLGHTYSVTYSPAIITGGAGERTITQTDPIGRTVVTTLNAFNQPVHVVDAAGRVFAFTYEPRFQRLASVQDPLGRQIAFEFDERGNTVAVVETDGTRLALAYNTAGQVTSTTDPLGNTTSYSYDPDHNLVKVRDPLQSRVRLAYDVRGRLVSITDPKGNQTTFSYDALDRLTSITDGLGNVSSVSYDANSNPVAVHNARGLTTTTTFDPLNRPVTVTDAKGRTASIVYDAGGDVASTTDPKGQTTQYTYDAEARLVRVAFADGTVHTYTYDDVGRVTDVSDGSRVWTFVYDILDRVTQAGSPQGTLEYAYDEVSRLIALTSPDTNYSPVAYVYDVRDRLTTITQRDQTYRFAYDALGRRTSLERPNGITTAYTYDAASQLTEITHALDAMVLEAHDYRYDRAGNVRRYIRSGVGITPDVAQTITRRYRYDALNRLVKVVSTVQPHQGKADLNTFVPESAEWTFDANSNITSKRSGRGRQEELRTYTYDEADQLVAVETANGSPNTISLTYDANGNLVRDSRGRAFTWDALDRLRRLDTTAGSFAFDYDPLGRRTALRSGSVDRRYLLNDLAVLSDSAAQFLYGAGIDEVLEIQTPDRRLAYLHDQLQSTTGLVDATSGERIARYDYTSYGDLEGQAANPVSDNPFTYTGREDDGSGLYYYRARYYDPEIEAFISQDPLGEAQRYVLGNPLRYTDPLGLNARRSSPTNFQRRLVTGAAGNAAPRSNQRRLVTGRLATGTAGNTARRSNTYAPTLFLRQLYFNSLFGPLGPPGLTTDFFKPASSPPAQQPATAPQLYLEPDPRTGEPRIHTPEPIFIAPSSDPGLRGGDELEN
jgi:RHS repeat-associated protein